MSGSAPDTTARRTRVVRVVTVGVIVVLTVLGWLLVDGTGSSDGGAGPVPTAASRSARTSPSAAATDPRPSGSRGTSAPTSTATDPDTGLRWVELAALPTQARTTITLIDAGGPFPYRKDGVVFDNRERLLPRHAGGYYHEYTVATPAEGDRGARRIVTGDGTRQLFYTDDHYASFRRVRR